MRRKLKQEGVLVAVLALLTTAIVLGSVVVATRSLSRGAPRRAVIRLPKVLLGPEPRVRLPSPPPVAESSASPSTSPTSRPRQRPTGAGSAVSAQTPAIQASMKGSITGHAGNSAISYEVTVRNSGNTVLKDFVASAHVPAGTVWKSGDGCDAGLPYRLRVSSKERLECSPGPGVSGTDDSGVHGFSIRIPDELAPSASLVILFELDLKKDAPAEVSNHSHVVADNTWAHTSTARVRTGS